jgi:hypothetical protein
MKHAWCASLLNITLLFASCGGSSPKPGSINGNWSAQVALADGAVLYSFSSSLTQASGSNVSVSNLSFSPASACFPQPTEQSAIFTVNGSADGFEIGPFGMTISATSNAQQNALTLAGERISSGWISGTWTLDGGSSCTGHGIFTMKPASTV